MEGVTRTCAVDAREAYSYADGQPWTASCDGKWIVSLYNDALRVHDVLTGRLLHSIKIQKTCFDMMPVPEQPALIVVGERGDYGDDEVHLYDIEDGEVHLPFCVRHARVAGMHVRRLLRAPDYQKHHVIHGMAVTSTRLICVHWHQRSAAEEQILTIDFNR